MTNLKTPTEQPKTTSQQQTGLDTSSFGSKPNLSDEQKREILNRNFRLKIEKNYLPKWVANGKTSATEIMALMTPSNKKTFILMLNSRTFQELQAPEIKFYEAIRKIQMFISVTEKNMLTENEIWMILDFLKTSKNKNNTINELVKAAEMYCDGQFPNIEKIYGTISTKFISSILDEYNKKQRSAALDELHRIIEEQNNKPYVMSLEEKKSAILAEFDRWKRTENPAEILNLGGCTFDFMQNDFGFVWTTDEKNEAVKEAVKYIEERKRMELLEAKSTEKAKIEAFLNGLVTDKTPAYSQAKTFLLHDKFTELGERDKLEKLLDLTITKAK